MLMHKQQGLSLIELMITISLGLLLMAALTTVFSNTLGVNSRSLQLSQLQEEATAVMELMVSDLRRTGYRADANELLTDPDNASTDFNDSIVISLFPGEAANSCIEFRYDANQDGAFNGAPEAFGYRVREGQIQRRQSAASCNSGGWQTLTSADMLQVDSLQFVLTERMLVNVNEQIVTIQMSVSAPSDATLSREFSTEVVIRNAY